MLTSELHSDHTTVNARPAGSVTWVSHYERWFLGFKKISSTRSLTDGKLERSAVLPYMNIPREVESVVAL